VEVKDGGGVLRGRVAQLVVELHAPVDHVDAVGVRVDLAQVDARDRVRAFLEVCLARVLAPRRRLPRDQEAARERHLELLRPALPQAARVHRRRALGGTVRHRAVRVEEDLRPALLVVLELLM
jgi:hypothetical protein